MLTYCYDSQVNYVCFYSQQKFWRVAKNKNDDQWWVSKLFNMPLICQANWFTYKQVSEQPLNTMKRNGPRSANISKTNMTIAE